MEQTADEAVDAYEVSWANSIRLKKETHLLDFVLESDSGKNWYIHKIVLFNHSDVLYRMSVAQGFKEAQTGRAKITGFSDLCIAGLVHYLYEIKFPLPPALPMKKEVKTYEDVKAFVSYFTGLWLLADMYNIQKLAKMTARRFDVWFFWDDEEMDLQMLDWVLKAIDEGGDCPAVMFDGLVKRVATAFRGDQEYEGDWLKEMLGKHHDFCVKVLCAMDKKSSHPQEAQEVQEAT